MISTLFFGRNIKYIHQFKGEISAGLRNRYLRYRIKFKLGKNQVKMYDKSNSLRIEVTINDPKDFKIYKEVESKDGTTTKTGFQRERVLPIFTDIQNSAKTLLIDILKLCQKSI